MQTIGTEKLIRGLSLTALIVQGLLGFVGTLVLIVSALAINSIPLLDGGGSILLCLIPVLLIPVALSFWLTLKALKAKKTGLFAGAMIPAFLGTMLCAAFTFGSTGLRWLAIIFVLALYAAIIVLNTTNKE